MKNVCLVIKNLHKLRDFQAAGACTVRTDQAATLIVKIIENKKLSDELKPETW